MINKYQQLKTSWDETVATLGALKPQNDAQTSIFFYPFHYEFKCKDVECEKYLKENNWEHCKELDENFHNIYKLTDYVKEALFDKNHIFKKKIDKEFEIWVEGEKKSSCNLEQMEVIFFEQNIAIISIFTSSMQTLQDISSIINRELRNPECLHVDIKNNRILSFDKTLKNCATLKEDYIKKYGELIEFNKHISGLIQKPKKIIINNLISGRAKYAKYLTAVHVSTTKDIEDRLTFAYPQLQHETDVTMNLLQIGANSLSVANDFIANSRKFEQDLDYVRGCIKNNGIRLWSLWSGVANLNSLAFLSINDGGKSIVHQSKNEIYLIYLINIYIKLRLQHLDKQIIDESFMQQNRSRENLENLFLLKAKYFSEEVADSFQPIFIDKKIKNALHVESLMKNIEENIVKTNEITKENNASIFAIILAIYVVVNEIVPYFSDSILAKIIIMSMGATFGFILWKKRNTIGKKFDIFLKKIGII